ncbi:hypothetical protein SmJEL517_g02379 [Synchytrium microbalum]|uniref:Major facilitator superfamily (MFS) profile domain-containing protein n=1 Tax=Synchytrium microbalum TaxID=1806994 RepID=A0A507CBX7_9FUNG|nr:uncharacterized protein SmJEL517_g02379 [Synchytrium microbalum]TPX35065.1 hypothetical protein SmJEL517_g02379 [Synchytrium microbalum]
MDGPRGSVDLGDSNLGESNATLAPNTTDITAKLQEVRIEEDLEHLGDIKQQYADLNVTDAEVKTILKKLDWTILPFCTILYLWSFLDRTNIGNARLVNFDTATGRGDFERDTNMSGSDFSWATSCFFFSYIICEVPSNLMLKRVSPSKWMSRIMITWGFFATMMAATTSFASVIAVRVLLGAAEAGLFPGLLFYCSFWYRRRELASRMALFYSGATLAGAFGSVIAYLITLMDGVGGLSAWRWIFILEGLPTIVVGVATWFLLPDFPHTAKFLTKREKAVLVARLKLDDIHSHDRSFNASEFWHTVKDVKTWLYCIMYITIVIPLYTLNYFLPTIVKYLGFASVSAQLMSAPPFAFACGVVILTCFGSDHVGLRYLFMIVPALVGCLGFLLLANVRNAGVLYFATFIAAAGSYILVPIAISWLSNNIIGQTRGATAIGMMIGVGNIGGIVAGFVYQTSDAPYFFKGHMANVGFLLISATFATIIFFFLRAENQFRNKQGYPIDDGKGEVIKHEDDKRFRNQL